MRHSRIILSIIGIISSLALFGQSSDVPRAIVLNDSIIVVKYPNLPSKAILVVDPSVVIETLNLPNSTYIEADSLLILQQWPRATFVADSAAMRRSKKERMIPIDHSLKGRFSWGADIGSSIDMTVQARSTMNISISFGYSRKWINFLGFGAEAAFTIGNSSRTYPLYANLRTNFRNDPSILFADFKVGVALNYPGDNSYHAGAYAGIGIGCYLIRTRTFSSHLILGYTYRQQNADWTPSGFTDPLEDLHLASLKIGVMF